MTDTGAEKKLPGAAVWLLLWILLCLLLPVAFFFAGGTVGGWMLPAAAVLAVLIYFRWFREEAPLGRGGACALAGITAAALLFSFLLFNVHWDGNTYHKTATGLLMDGWNPLENDCTAVLPGAKITEGIRYNAQWIDHYANGGWVIAAVFGSCFHNVEIGKAVNLLIAAAVFGILTWYLSLRIRSAGWRVLIAAAAVFQPVTVSQMESFYIDGNLYLFLLLGVVALLMLGDSKCGLKKRYPLLFLSVSIVYCINVKFTGAAYIGFFCIASELCWLVLGARKKRFVEVFLKSTALFVGMAAFAVLLVGYSSYVCNFLEKGSPLYPLVGGDETIDIMAYSEPNTFAGKSGVEKSLISLFGKTENVTNSSDRKPEVKLPFTVSFSEIKECVYTDTRIGGMGPWFGGLFLVSLILSVRLIAAYRDREPALCAEWAVVLVTAVLMYLFLPGSWWARYSAYLYFFVISALFYLAVRAEEEKEKKPVWVQKAGAAVFLVLVFCNTACFLLAPAAGAYLSVGIWRDREVLRQASEEEPVLVCCRRSQMTGIFWNLDCWGVNYEVTEEKIEGESAYRGELVWKK